MRFLLVLILSLGFFGGEAGAAGVVRPTDTFERIEVLIADNTQINGANINNLNPLSKIMTQSKVREKKATTREFLLMIQAWDYIARNSGGNERAIKDSLLQSQRTDKTNAYIAFNYLLSRTKRQAGAQEALAQQIANETSTTSENVQKFFRVVQWALNKIEADRITDKIDIEGEGKGETTIISGVQDDPQSVLIDNGLNPRDYRTTERLVTFEFDKDSGDLVSCVNPTMPEYKSNPFAIYRRPIPTFYAGETALQSGNLRINQPPYFLYQILLTDNQGNEIIYGFTNPYYAIAEAQSAEILAGKRHQEQPGTLVQLSRGDVSDDMRNRVRDVEAYIKNNNYMIPPIQLMDNQAAAAIWQAAKEEKVETQPGVVLGKIRLPMLEHLIFNPNQHNVLIQSDRRLNNKEPEFFAIEAMFDENNTLVQGLKGTRVPFAYYKDQQTAADYAVKYLGVPDAISNLMELRSHQDTAANRSAITRIERYIANPPQFFLIKSSVVWQDVKNTPEFKHLYVTQVLYRWDIKKGLIQVSMGIPAPDIAKKKLTLEKHLQGNIGLAKDLVLEQRKNEFNYVGGRFLKVLGTYANLLREAETDPVLQDKIFANAPVILNHFRNKTLGADYIINDQKLAFDLLFGNPVAVFEELLRLNPKLLERS